MRLPMPVTSRTTTARHRRPLTVAHRGASAQVAENTLAAMRRAIALDSDLVEVDVQRTRDGALVLMHDTTLVRTTNVKRVFPGRGPWRVADFSYDELMRLDAGGWKSPDHAGERIPTLAEAVEVVRRSRTGLLLELKAPGRYPGLVSDVVAALWGIPGYLDPAVAARRLAVQSFDVAAMKDHKTQLPAVPVGLLGTPPPVNLPALASWADQVNPSHVAVNEGYVDHVHSLGMECFVWTVNGRPAMRRAIRMGADGIITNRPDALAAVVTARAGSTVVEEPGEVSLQI